MKAVLAVIAVIVLAGLTYFLYTQRAAAPLNEEMAVPSPTETSTEENADIPIVTYSDTGFSPSSITISAGGTVRFINSSSHGMWVGSDDHPTHTHYDGTATREHCVNGTNTTGTFDQCTASASGTTWEYTFTKAGTWGYHNHARSENTGTVVVQ